MSLSDKNLLEQFETRILSPDELNHVSHLRIAWLYLTKFDLNEAIKKIGTYTREYAESLGDTGKYHQTITEATARIMDKRMSKLESRSFEEFLQYNRDLADDLKSLLRLYYTEAVLESDNARANFVQPDRKRFD